MKFDKKGVMGFPEAIMAVMIVTLSLAAFMGMVALDLVDNINDEASPIDAKVIENILIDEGSISFQLESDLMSMIDRNGYRGISVKYIIPGNLGFDDGYISIGSMEGDIVIDRFLVSLNSSDGRVITAIAEVAVCI